MKEFLVLASTLHMFVQVVSIKISRLVFWMTSINGPLNLETALTKPKSF